MRTFWFSCGVSLLSAVFWVSSHITSAEATAIEINDFSLDRDELPDELVPGGCSLVLREAGTPVGISQAEYALFGLPFERWYVRDENTAGQVPNGVIYFEMTPMTGEEVQMLMQINGDWVWFEAVDLEADSQRYRSSDGALGLSLTTLDSFPISPFLVANRVSLTVDNAEGEQTTLLAEGLSGC